MIFEKLDKVVEIDVRYTTRSALAIQAGKQVGFELVESPVIRVGAQPVIPGSSLKGGLRSTLEAILAQKGETVCVPMAAIPKEYNRRQEEYARMIGRKKPCEGPRSCSVCQIFGAASLCGRAIVLDATPRGQVELVERTHVALTRDTRSAAGGKLMTVQSVDAGAVFEGTIRVVNPEDWHVGAILQALDGLEMLGMGSKKTAGYGELEIEVQSVKIRRLGAEGWQDEDADQETYRQAFGQKFGG